MIYDVLPFFSDMARAYIVDILIPESMFVGEGDVCYKWPILYFVKCLASYSHITNTSWTMNTSYNKVQYKLTLKSKI